MGSLSESGRAALEAARLGDVERGAAWLAQIGRSGLEGADAETRAVGASVVGAVARHAALGLDVARVRELRERLVAVRADAGDGAILGELLDGWLALLEGREVEAARLAAGAGARATEARHAELLVESTALLALARLVSGDAADGLRVARRASRMARTEAIPASEALAHLVLARARRATGNPHLSLRITRGLAASRVVSHRGWLALERGLAGGTERDQALDTRSPLAILVESLRIWVAATEAGKVEVFEDATRALLQHARRLPPFVARDVERLVLATDGRLDASGTALAPFLGGTTSDVPAELQGLATLRGGAAAEGESAVFYVASFGPDHARRVARLGRSLASARLSALKQTRMKQGRTETVVAALLLAGRPGLPEEECFRAVYGFAYVPELHRGAFDVTLHRAREWLGDLGAIERKAGVVTLSASRPLLCPDPRCSGSVSDKILVALADEGARSAKEVADLTGVPLRAVQAALAELVEDGACDARPGAGRAMEYVVEDTTFSEPTDVAGRPG